MTPFSAESLISTLEWRYAVKSFDAARRIPEDTWAALERSLVLTPSSFGLQPWKFLVVTSQELKDRLRPHCWNQRQIAECSHLVVLAVLQEIDQDFVDRFIALNEERRGMPAGTLEGYRKVITGSVVQGGLGLPQPEWAARQAYIALGQFMLAAAGLGVDTCPMEGFAPEALNAELGLPERGLKAVVLCPAGYRSPEDKYAAAPKIRWPHHEVIERL
ncbi:MAG: NAD(P)H-dependent oxidoreductase [Verrucomicrobiaceae bacterium]|nr:MAG: NAD(P)H-dependent oxidoreductase [Verrucomicrobiaceae bacterium]